MRVALAVSQAPQDLPPGERALLAALSDVGISACAETWSARDTRWSKYNAVVVRSCWDYHLRVDEFRRWLDRLQEENIAVFNSPELIRWNIDKGYLRELSERGVPIPQTIWLERGQELDLADLCQSNSWAAAVVKPLVSASAYETERSARGIVHGPIMVQEYLAEIESEGEWSLLYFEGELSHAIRKQTAPGDFRVQAEFGGTAELLTPPPALLEAAARILALLPIRPLFARVDMVRRNSSALLMELELIEPELFLSLATGASRRLALAIRTAVG